MKENRNFNLPFGPVFIIPAEAVALSKFWPVLSVLNSLATYKDVFGRISGGRKWRLGCPTDCATRPDTADHIKPFHKLHKLLKAAFY